jgi:hypothetical protein
VNASDVLRNNIYDCFESIQEVTKERILEGFVVKAKKLENEDKK